MATIHSLAAARQAKAQKRVTNCQAAWSAVWQQAVCVSAICFWQLQQQFAAQMVEVCAHTFVKITKHRSK